MVALWCTRGLLRQASLYFLFSHGGVSHIVVSIHCHHLIVSHRHDTTSSYVDTSSQGEEVLPCQNDILHNSIGGSKIYFHDKLLNYTIFATKYGKISSFWRVVVDIDKFPGYAEKRMEWGKDGRVEWRKDGDAP